MQNLRCIFISTLDKIQVGYRILNLKTGKIVTCMKFTEIPITTQVIHRVEYLSELYGIKPNLLIKTRKGELYQNDDLIARVDDNKDFTDKDYIAKGKLSDTNLIYEKGVDKN